MTARVSPPNWLWAAGSQYTPAVRVGDLVLTSGVAPFDEYGQVIGDDLETQTRKVVTNLAELLAHAGSGLERIVRQHVYLKREEDVARFAALRPQLYRPPYPASVLVVVTAHARPDMLIEIACEALAR
jgi:2-iminobutanoate/2-iminopropanoate deaminase